jgi:hypothetical protein
MTILGKGTLVPWSCLFAMERLVKLQITDFVFGWKKPLASILLPEGVPMGEWVSNM